VKYQNPLEEASRRILLPIFRFFSPIIEMLRQINQVSVYNKKFLNSGLSIAKDNSCSVTPEIAVFIPVAVKDYDKVSQCVSSLRRHLLNPINQIILCGKNDKQLQQICADLKCEFIDENMLAPIKKNQIQVHVNGSDRSGWVYQQILKLSLFDCVKVDNALIWDADTCLNRKMLFTYEGTSVLEYEPNFHLPYFLSATKLLGEVPNLGVEFTCHKLLVNRRYMREMFDLIESKSNKKWFIAYLDVIDSNEVSSISEYATYSLFMLRRYPKKVYIQHWRNIAEHKKTSSLRRIVLSIWFRSISHHDYAQNKNENF
jgi:hypothetical protein